MAVKKINLTEFNAGNPERNPSARLLVEELEFYSAWDGFFRAVLSRELADQTYLYAIFRSNEMGSHRWWSGNISFPTREAAREELLAELETIDTRGRPTPLN